ncbi:porin family protein [Maribacter sp. 2307ULW6-5]|uniref:porin family protein n=1 Tax=Maribacter sp. 2307ULW6-5 TaxID=3386275 RepID=UPI0039BD1198
MRGLLFILFFTIFGWAVAQDIDQESPSARYFEDQFYFGVNYNFLRNTPSQLTQRNLSYGLQAGFIKDLPLNVRGTKALGIGLGLGMDTYYSNLVVRESNGGFSYDLDPGLQVRRSKVETHTLAVPIQFRWRNSTRTEYRFWRVYTGLRLAYVLGARSKLVTTDFKESFFNTDVADFQYGLELNVGYNTFNVHLYYGLNDIFGPDVVVNGETVGLRPLRVGLIFFIL